MASGTIRASFTEQTVYQDTVEMLGKPGGRLRTVATRHGISLARVVRYCVRHGIAAAEAIEAGNWPPE